MSKNCLEREKRRATLPTFPLYLLYHTDSPLGFFSYNEEGKV